MGFSKAEKPSLRDRPWVDGAASAIVGGIVAGWLIASVDAAARHSWVGVDRSQHVASVAMMFAALGVVVGIVVAGASLIVAAARKRVAGVWSLIGTSLVAAVLSSMVMDGPIRGALSGLAERDAASATQIIRLAHVAVAIGTAALVAMCQFFVARSLRGRAVLPMVFGVLLVGTATGFAWADLTVMPALYAQIHETVEVVAWFLGSIGGGLVVFSAARRWRVLSLPLRVAAGLTVASSLIWFSGDQVTAQSSLGHIRREPHYVGRMMLRLELARDFLEDPTTWRSAQDARLARLVKRYDIVTVEQSPDWDLPRPVAEAAPSQKPMNVVVIFVDTLRYDVAMQSEVMPRVAALRRESLAFERTYSTASDTVSSLPVLTGGCYSRPEPCRGDLVTEVAKQGGVPSVLAIPKSARRFLGKHAPDFEFEEVLEVADYEEGKRVWGYGADRSSAVEISRQALSWIDAHENQRFFLWAFHFDVHNWMQLNPDYLAEVAQRHGIARSADDKAWAYRAAAAGVDEGIGVLLDGLSERGLDDETAVLLVADHGEALGHQGHWQHAVYLWESLVRVPMLLRVPGVAARRHAAPVGHVDVAPTLARLIHPAADMRVYHGVDLLSGASSESALPILLFSMRRDDLLRVGLVSRDEPYFKLELPVDSVEPDLFDLSAASPDDAEVRDEHRGRTLELLSKLVTSPVFPRPEKVDKTVAAAR